MSEPVGGATSRVAQRATTTAPHGANLDPNACITCSDALLEVLVTRVSDDGTWADGTCAGQECSVSVELLAGVRAGDVILTQGGVALQFRQEGTP